MDIYVCNAHRVFTGSLPTDLRTPLDGATQQSIAPVVVDVTTISSTSAGAWQARLPARRTALSSTLHIFPDPPLLSSPVCVYMYVGSVWSTTKD